MNTIRKFPELRSETIKGFRRARGLSQQDLAMLLGVGVATVSRWERGTPPTGTAAEVLHAAVAGLVFGHNPVEMTHGSGYLIYRLLKEVFEHEKDMRVMQGEKPI